MEKSSGQSYKTNRLDPEISAVYPGLHVFMIKSTQKEIKKTWKIQRTQTINEFTLPIVIVLYNKWAESISARMKHCQACLTSDSFSGAVMAFIF